MYFRPPIENWTMIEIDRRRSKLDCFDWCKEHFDNRGGEYATWLYYGDCKFEFEHEEDAVLFSLRWL
jgi:hypothetical protein